MDFERYTKNTGAFSRAEVEKIQRTRVCVVGCGGLGGHVLATLARFGALRLTAIDGDAFSVSNLNRQRFATEKTLGQNKAEAAKQALREVNSAVEVDAVPTMLAEDNALQLLAGHDLVMDCLDSRAARRILNEACGALKIPYVHGAVAGFYGQVANVFPGDGLLDLIYAAPGGAKQEVENALGNPPFTPQLVAAIQCSEALKLLCNRTAVLRGSLLTIDLLHNEFETISLAR